MVKFRQLIQRLSAFLVFLSTIFAGKQPLLYRLHETKLPPLQWFCASADDQRPLKTPAVQRVPRVVFMSDVIVQGAIHMCTNYLMINHPQDSTLIFANISHSRTFLSYTGEQ